MTSVFSSLLNVLDASKDDPQSSLPSKLLGWNESIESVLADPDSTTSTSFLNETAANDMLAILCECCKSIHNSIISQLLSNKIKEVGSMEGQNRADEAPQAIKIMTPRKDFYSVAVISILLRTAKNLLRSYIQIVLPSLLQVKGIADYDNPTDLLRSQTMIKLYLELIEEHSTNHTEIERQDSARNASLALFYATYSGNSSDTTVQRAQIFLIEGIDFPRIAMKVFVQHNSTPLLISVMRNIQNLIVSVPQATKSFEELAFETETQTEKAPWVPSGEVHVSFLSLTEHLMWWLLRETDPPFPGRIEDRGDDLAIEILRTWYAMRVGRILASPTADTLMARIVAETMLLPDSDERCYECKLAMIGILTDSNQVFGDYLASRGVLPVLLRVLEQQVSHVVDESAIGSSAAAAVVPILVVVNKYSVGNPETKTLVKSFVFPEEAEPSFRTKAAEEIKRSAGTEIGAKNMSPLDAPKGTLRWKLFKLMTWTQSNTKRIAGELMWTLCDNDRTQFVLRTGMGNALPILAAKGFAKLPL